MESADGPCAVEIEKPRDTVLDVTVKDDVDDQGHDVIVIDSIYDAGTADRLLDVNNVWIMCVNWRNEKLQLKASNNRAK